MHKTEFTTSIIIPEQQLGRDPNLCPACHMGKPSPVVAYTLMECHSVWCVIIRQE